MKKALKILLGLFLVCVVLVGCLVIFVQFFFPNETVRQELETRLSEQVQGTVTIQSLAFEILSGLHVAGVDVMKNQKKVVHLDELILDYNVWHLLRGTLVLNEVRLNKVDLILDLQDFEAKPSPEQQQSPESSSPPVIPVMVDLQNFSVRDSTFKISRGEEFSTTLKETDLQASFAVGLTLVELAGTLHVGQGEFITQGKQLRLPLDSAFSLSLNLGSELLTISSFSLQSPSAVQLNLSGTVKQVLTKKDMDLTLSDAKIELGPTLDLIRDFLPPHVVMQQMAGTVKPAGVLNGSFLDSGFDGTVRAEVLGENLQGTFPNVAARLSPTTLTLRTDDIPIQKSVPQSLKAELHVTGQGVQVQQYEIKHLTLTMLGEHVLSGLFSGSLDLQGLLSTPALPSIGSISQPLELKIATTGDISSQMFELSDAMVKVEKLLLLTAKGHVGPVEGNDGIRKATMSLHMEPQMDALVSLLSQDRKDDLVVRKTGDKDVVSLEATGDLDQDFVPQFLKVDGSIHATNLAANSPARGLKGTVTLVDFLVDGTYAKKTGKLKGTISSDLLLSGLSQKAVLSIGKVKAHLDSRLHGTVSSEQTLTRLISQDLLTIGLDQFQYHASDVTARLNKVALRSNSKEHVLAGRYQLNKLQVSSGTAFRLDAQGQFQTDKQEFVFDAKVPYFNIGQLLQQISGTGVQSLAKMSPTGRLSLAIKTAGRIPETTTIDPFQFPVTVASRLTLKDVTGAFQGHQVVGANGALSLSFQPKRQQLLKAFTDLRIDSLAMAPGYPLSRASDVFANLDLAVEEFDRMRMHDVHLGFDGATVAVNGTVHGIRDLLEGKPQAFARSVGPLFAKVESQAAVDFSKVAEVLKPYGVIGTGKSDLSVTLLKKEKGPLDAQIHLRNRHLSLTQDQTRLVNLHGSLSLRKRLEWEKNPKSFARLPSFSPTTLLPKLQYYSSKERRIQIERLDLNGLTISNLTGGIQFDRDRLIIRNLAMNVLRGGLGGNLLLKSGNAFGVTTKLEATGLDLHALLDSDSAGRGESLVDGIVDLRMFFDEQKGRLDFARSRMNLEFPKIGRDALDRLLQFLDPTGSNPSIVGVRATVKLANPSKVRMTLNKGLLGVTIKFQNRLIPDFPLPRIPVGTIKDVQTFTDTIPQWGRIRELMQLLGATRYGVDQEGNFALQ